jgi:cytochrome c peroxidase
MKYAALACAALMLASCAKEPAQPGPAYDPTPFELEYGSFPPPPLPPDNALRVAVVELGRMLFHDKALSSDGTQACASCHLQEFGFSDPSTLSIGVQGLPGRRQSMALVNLAWHRNGFFWDGRAPTLREQALEPIEDPLELNESLDRIVTRLGADPQYQDALVRAFGDDAMTEERMGLALEQFMFTLVSADSRFDRYLRGEESLTDSELRGLELFNAEFDPTGVIKGAECFHCHGGFALTNDRFMNNGLDTEPYTDPGRFEVTGRPEDRGRFKVPTLRNIAVTAPYMHDGRFATLREVIDHYDHGVKASPTVDPLLQFSISPGLQLSEQDKQDLEAYLLTLTDERFLGR